MDYAKTKEIIHSTSILSNEDTDFIDQSIGRIQENWAKNQRYRTETEMRISVLNDLRFPTPAAKYWQCVREQSVFYESLISNSFQFRRLEVKIKRLEAQIAECEDELDRAELQIDLEEALFSKLNLEAEAKDRVRELRLWDQLMAEQLEIDSSFNSEDVNQHQLESYRARFAEQAKSLSDNTPIGERNNLLGQIMTADRVSREREHVAIEKKPDGDTVELKVQWKQ